jgi:hypothetical protein
VIVDAELGQNGILTGLVLAGADGTRQAVSPSRLEVDAEPEAVRLTARAQV